MWASESPLTDGPLLPNIKGRTERCLVMVTGLQGTGKSTIAEAAGRILDGAVLAHDWVMSGLRPYPALQQALESMDPPGHRAVGWSVLLALARSQLRAGRSVVLDGMARGTEASLARQVAAEEDSPGVVILTECADPVVHRSRIEGRLRHIPHWYELTWDHVQRSRETWTPPSPVDLCLEATDPLDVQMDRLSTVLVSPRRA